jgi:hypothetical protein
LQVAIPARELDALQLGPHMGGRGADGATGQIRLMGQIQRPADAGDAVSLEP